MVGWDDARSRPRRSPVAHLKQRCFTEIYGQRPASLRSISLYMVAKSDRSINPDQERMMAKRAPAKTVEVSASHVAYMSHPKETAKLIEAAATSARAN